MTKPVVVIEHEAGTGASLMTELLGLGVRIVRPYLGEPLPAVDDLAGLVVLGGSMGAGDAEIAPWLPATRRLIQEAVRTEQPILGICLGAQLLAAACGGTVERGSVGLELGLVPVTPLAGVDGDPFFGRIHQALTPSRPGDWLVRQYHYDAVTRLPADTELLVTGQLYPHQGFRVGRSAWGVQYHPEVSTELFAQWVETSLRSGDLPTEAIDVLGPVRNAAATQLLLATVHATAFLDVVSDAGVVGGLR